MTSEDGEGDVERDDPTVVGTVLNEAYDTDVSVAVVSNEFGVPGRRGLGLDKPGLERVRTCIPSSSSDSATPAPRANGLGSSFRWIQVHGGFPLPCTPSDSSSDVSAKDSLSPEGREINGSPLPT